MDPMRLRQNKQRCAREVLIELIETSAADLFLECDVRRRMQYRHMDQDDEEAEEYDIADDYAEEQLAMKRIVPLPHIVSDIQEKEAATEFRNEVVANLREYKFLLHSWVQRLPFEESSALMHLFANHMTIRYIKSIVTKKTYKSNILVELHNTKPKDEVLRALSEVPSVTRWLRHGTRLSVEDLNYHMEPLWREYNPDSIDHIRFMSRDDAIGIMVTSEGRLHCFFAGKHRLCFPREGDELNVLYRIIEPLKHTMDNRACPDLYVTGMLNPDSLRYLLHRMGCCAVDHFKVPNEKDALYSEPYVYPEEREIGAALGRVPTMEWLDKL